VIADFFVELIPPTTTHHAKQIVVRRIKGSNPPKFFGSLADKPELVEAREVWRRALAPHAPKEPAEGPLVLFLEFTWPWLKGDKAEVRSLGRVPLPQKPDGTNIGKTVEDVMAKLGYMVDDKQIVDVRVRKFRGDWPGLRVRLRHWEDEIKQYRDVHLFEKNVGPRTLVQNLRSAQAALREIREEEET
jgi:Holliday junction resolvase RusA-like endonuclease